MARLATNYKECDREFSTLLDSCASNDVCDGMFWFEIGDEQRRLNGNTNQIHLIASCAFPSC